MSRRRAKWLTAVILMGIASTSAAETKDTKELDKSSAQVTELVKDAKAAATAIKERAAQDAKSALAAKTKALKDETLKTTTEAAKATANRLKDGALSDLKTATEQTQTALLAEQARLQAEIASLRADLKKSQALARAEMRAALSPLSWLLELSPNIDGSLAFQLGSELSYLDRLLVGLKYMQIQRTERESCDEFATSSCKAYTDIRDHVVTLKAFGYELPLGRKLRLTVNLNGVYLHQETEGTSVDTGLDRYVEKQGGFTSLQVNTQVEFDWRITDDTFFHLEASVSPYHRSVEKETGFDSGLLARTSMNSDRVGNNNNRVYSGELGTYSKYFDNNESTYFDGSSSLYIRNLIGESDATLGLDARYLSYGADANRTVVFNGELKDVNTSRRFEKLDIMTKLAFELSFLGFIPSNPMLGLTYTWSTFDGFREKVSNQSFGFAFSFATPPK